MSIEEKDYDNRSVKTSVKLRREFIQESALNVVNLDA